MKIYTIIVFCLVVISQNISAQDSLHYLIKFHQTGSYLESDRATLGGFGFGSGLEIDYGKNLTAQLDANILWGNGNAASTRLALGYKFGDNWSPAFFVTYELLFGQRIEVLAGDGSRLPSIVWAAGFRLHPLQFETETNSFSVLEIGYGISPYRGFNLEISILSVGIRL